MTPEEYPLPPRKPSFTTGGGLGLAASPVSPFAGIVGDPNFPRPGPEAGWSRSLWEMMGDRYNAPAMTEYPTSEAASGAYDAAYGSGMEGFMRPGGHAPFNAYTGESGLGLPSDSIVEDNMRRAFMAIKANPVAALGFDPRMMQFWDVPKELTGRAGEYNSETDMMGMNQRFPSTAVHESMHRGIEKIRKLNLFPSELSGIAEEYIARYMMKQFMGNPEWGEGDFGDMIIDNAGYHFERSDESEKLQTGLNKLMSVAAQIIAKQKPMGPR